MRYHTLPISCTDIIRHIKKYWMTVLLFNLHIISKTNFSFNSEDKFCVFFSHSTQFGGEVLLAFLDFKCLVNLFTFILGISLYLAIDRALVYSLKNNILDKYK